MARERERAGLASALCWRLVDKLSRTLMPDERDAVRGDFDELALSGPQALREVASVVIRREIEAWRDWRRWIVLAGVVLPLGLLLGLVAARLADYVTIYGWLYTHNWSPAILTANGSRNDLMRFLATSGLQSFTLTARSWVCGVVIASLVQCPRANMRKRPAAVTPLTMAIYGTMLLLVLLTGSALARSIVGVPFNARVSMFPWIAHLLHRARENPYNAEFFASFYGTTLPVLLPVMFVLLPLLAGMRRVAAGGVSAAAIVLGLTMFDAATGKERWHAGYPAAYTPGRPAAHGAGPKATPVFHAGRLYTLGVSGIVAAFDAANGKLMCRTEPPAEAPFFNAASSPLIEQGLLIVRSPTAPRGRSRRSRVNAYSSKMSRAGAPDAGREVTASAAHA